MGFSTTSDNDASVTRVDSKSVISDPMKARSLTKRHLQAHTAK